MKKRTSSKCGLFYVSRGRWTGPYANLVRAEGSWKRYPLRDYVTYLKNELLKSRVEIRKVG